MQPPPHLSAPAPHEEATSGAEDEGQDDVEADIMEDEGMADEPEDKDLENPEEREKFYQEVRVSVLYPVMGPLMSL